MTINILIDLETAAKTERAAILSIGAVPFILPSDDVYYADNETGGTSSLSKAVSEVQPYFAAINATSCIMEGMEFDQDTVNWWSRQSNEAKNQFADNDRVKNIEQAFIGLVEYIRNIKQKFGCEIQIWTQGTDFDVPKIRYCCTKIAEIPEDQLPWKYNAVRDARTYVLEGLAILHGRKPTKDAYKDIPADPHADTIISHDVICDCLKSIWSVKQVNEMLFQIICSH